MKRNFILFLSSFIIVFSAILLGSYSYLKVNDKKIYNSVKKGEVRESKNENKGGKREKEELTFDTLEEAIRHSKRINFLFLGMEEVRTDSLIFASFDPKNKKVDIISIPRDTYVHREGYDEAEERKINAVYGEHEIEGIKETVSYILGGIPIHHYIMADYDSVAKIIDSVGGVEVNVPFHMRYYDFSAKPSVNIDIPEGNQLLDGKKSVDFLRYRKGSDGKGGYADGDLGRIRAQQEFMQSFIDKVLSYKLPTVISTGIELVETDINLGNGLLYGKDAMGIKKDSFTFTTLPGIAEFKAIKGKTLSYFFYDERAVKDLMGEIYKVKK